MEIIEESLDKLIKYIEKENYKGHDPYDALNSWIPFHVFGKWGPIVGTQLLKRSPINIRQLIGIKKDYNSKGMGLILKAYCNLYRLKKNEIYLEKAQMIFEWLINNYIPGYSGIAWGYNFPWANPKEYVCRFMPTVVATANVVDGLFCYWGLTKDERAKRAIISAAEYVKKDIPTIKLDEGVGFGYHQLSREVCYNASLFAAEILLRANIVEGVEPNNLIKDAVSLVLSKQKDDGSWYYSYDPVKRTERRQIDFHQGFVLVSLHTIYGHTNFLHNQLYDAISRGLKFYKCKEFEPNGKSRWRYPAIWPVDIHNQSQGIITFSLLKDYHPDYLDFANTVAQWTIKNMQDESGYFYYRGYRLFTNKISYMRWSNAWMLLALSTLLLNDI